VEEGGPQFADCRKKPHLSRLGTRSLDAEIARGREVIQELQSEFWRRALCGHGRSRSNSIIRTRHMQMQAREIENLRSVSNATAGAARQSD